MPELPNAAGNIVPATESKPDPVREELRAELREARAAGQRWRRISRWMGLGIFVIGALLLVYVFWQAIVGFHLYRDRDYLSEQLNAHGGDNIQASIIGVAAVIGRELMKVLYLLILGFLASAIAARGIQFFAASEAVIDEAVVPDDPI
jgi:hypothetical protein